MTDNNGSYTTQQGFNSLQVGYKLFLTVETMDWKAVEFQFLIGWLQTILRVFQMLVQTVFQFLIGWLQTSPLHTPSELDAQVSIPYRLATNLLNIHLILTRCYQSFNSLQVGYKQAISISTVIKLASFQFLIGWLQTRNTSLQTLGSLDSFNSLQVGYKLLWMI